MESERTPLLAQPTDITDFEKCIPYTDEAITEDPKSNKAAKWTARLVELAVNPDQSPVDLKHRPFEAYVRQTRLLGSNGQPTDQARAAGDKLVEIATNEENPSAKEHRLREAYYAQAVVQRGTPQITAGEKLLELTKPGAITDPGAQQHWAFTAPHVVSQISMLSRDKRLEYAQQAKENITNTWQSNESKKVFDSLHTKSRGEKAKEMITQSYKTAKDFAKTIVCCGR